MTKQEDILKQKIIVILGQTSSGKSDLAVEIAKKFNGEIISADSRQVYRGMDLGTGKVPLTKNPPPPQRGAAPVQNGAAVARLCAAGLCALPSPFPKKGGGCREGVKISGHYKGIPHHLLDVASPKRRFTVAQYKTLTQKAIKDIQKRGKIPILCGGTGLYIQAVVDDLQIPSVKPNFGLRAELEKKSVAELFAILQKLDPVRAANIDSKNPRRLIRAIEIVKTTGKPVPPLYNAPQPPLYKRGGAPSLFQREGWGELNFSVLFLGIKKSPAELKELIQKRLLKRFKQGMIKEVSDLRNSGVSWKRLDSFGLEYRWLALFLRKKITRNEMLARLQKEIEHYAKRQMTWFKRDGRIHWLKNKKQAMRLVQNFLH